MSLKSEQGTELGDPGRAFETWDGDAPEASGAIDNSPGAQALSAHRMWLALLVLDRRQSLLP
jgi:hypothetical protein